METLDELAQAELAEAMGGVDEHVAVTSEPGEQVRLVEQRRVLDDQRVRLGDRLVGPDRLVIDPAERHHRRAHPLRAEARERLRVPVLAERGRGQQLGGGDHALAASPVKPHLEHRPRPSCVSDNVTGILRPRPRGGARPENVPQLQLAMHVLAGVWPPVAGMASWVISGRRARVSANSEPSRARPPRVKLAIAAM